jgi:hypothetical protein
VTFANIEQVNVQNPAPLALTRAGGSLLSNESGLTGYETAAGQDLAARWGIAQGLLIGQSDGIGWLTAHDTDTPGEFRSDDPLFWLKAKKLRAAGRLAILRQ